MDIGGVGSMGSFGLDKIKNYSFVEESIAKKEKNVSTVGSFDSFLTAAMDTIDETSSLEQRAQQLQLDYITGKSDDMLSVLLAEQKAYTALNFSVQVTNKVIEAYKQIISLQI